MDFLLVANIQNTVGLKGVVKVSSSTFFQKQRFKKDSILYVKKGDEYTPLTIVSSYTNNKNYFLTFKDYDTIEKAEQLKGLDLYGEKDYSILKKDEFFFSDLEKMKVQDEKGKYLGDVKKVEEFPAQITLRVVQKNGKDFFVPYLKSFIKNIDSQKKIITIKLIEGML